MDQCESAWLSKTYQLGMDELAPFGLVSERALKRGPQMQVSAYRVVGYKNAQMPLLLYL